MLRVGLTGGIACGKSHVLRRLDARGWRTLDLDRVAHEVMAPGGPAYPELLAAFGAGILGPAGEIDRKALAAVVFADDAARERLNGIVHPHVRREEARRLAAPPAQPAPVAVTDAALLVEAGLHLRFDRLVVVHCPPEEQLRRLLARDSLTPAAAAARIAAQMPLAEKRRFAHLEVDSSGSPADTDAATDRLAETLESLAREPNHPIAVSGERLWAQLRGRGGGPLGIMVRLLDEIAVAGGLELPRIAALLGRPGQGWLAPPDAEAVADAAALAAPVVAWSLARRGADDEFLGLAALSLARAVTAEPARVASACARAFSLARELGSPGGNEEAARLAFVRRWAGAEPPAREPPAPAQANGASATESDARAAMDRFLAASVGWGAGRTP